MGLIAALTRRQEEKGFLADEDLRSLAEELRVPLYRLQGLVSFYPHFRRSPPAQAEVALCRDMSCHLSQGVAFAAAVERQLAWTWRREPSPSGACPAWGGAMRRRRPA